MCSAERATAVIAVMTACGHSVEASAALVPATLDNLYVRSHESIRGCCDVGSWHEH